MNQALKNIFAVIAGAVVGSFVNMGIILISNSIIPPPAGADVTTIEGLKASMHLFEPRHFVFPFLAHAIGTFAGALLAAVLSSKNKERRALIVGVIFLIGGISNVVMLPSPTWFTIVDLVGAYIPFAWLAAKIACRKTSEADTL